MGIRTKGEEVSRILKLTSTFIAVIIILMIVIDKPVYGTHHKEFNISTEDDLRELCKIVNEVNADNWKYQSIDDFKDVTFILKNDIKLTSEWTPIGIDSSYCFNGTFNGNGHAITNISINDYYENSGFFGYLDGSVYDLTIEGNVDVNGGNCGGLVGTLTDNGYVKNCISTVNVKGKDKVGGIVGNNEGGRIEDSINKGSIRGTHKVGGVAGENWGGSIYNCANTGHVKSTRRGVATYGTGGIAGRSLSSDSIISESYNIGNINSNTEGTGGIVGYVNGLESTVRNSYNKGNITITLKDSNKEITRAYCGGIVGIVGSAGVKIFGCYNSGTIRNADKAGGIIGKYINDNSFKNEDKHILNNYYIVNKFDNSIGNVNDKRDDSLDKVGKGVSARNLDRLILRWQATLNSPLDDNLTTNKNTTTYGQVIMDLLSPDKITTKAFILYMEAQDILKLQKEDR